MASNGETNATLPGQSADIPTPSSSELPTVLITDVDALDEADLEVNRPRVFPLTPFDSRTYASLPSPAAVR
jgi:hypothetical protein